MKLPFCRWNPLFLKVFVLLLALSIAGILFTTYGILNCDEYAQKQLVQTPNGNAIPKYDHTLEFVKFGELSKKCEYVNEKIECLDVRKSGQTVLRQAQLAIVRMLKIIDLICEKHSIKYWLLSGTLLGAYRNGKFIPWDNDADIGIMYEDYLKLLKAFNTDLPKDLFLQNGSDEPSYMKSKHVEAKLKDRNSCYGRCLRKGCQFHDGLMVDIFVFKRQSHDSNKIISIPKNRFKFHLNQIFPLRKIDFEDVSLSAPKNTEEILKLLFGKGFLNPKRNQCPDDGYTAIPWYSCSFIESLSPAIKRAILEDSMVHRSIVFWYY